MIGHRYDVHNELARRENILAKARGGDFAHPGEEEAIVLMASGLKERVFGAFLMSAVGVAEALHGFNGMTGAKLSLLILTKPLSTMHSTPTQRSNF